MSIKQPRKKDGIAVAIPEIAGFHPTPGDAHDPNSSFHKKPKKIISGRTCKIHKNQGVKN